MLLAECKCIERRCKHFIGVGEDEPIELPEGEEGIYFLDSQAWICKAFPKYPGIPPAIVQGFDLHERQWKTTDGYREDQKNNIVYEREKS